MRVPVQPTTRGGGRPFVPLGVDAQSWLGFEHRIQQRRFQALVVAAQQAISAGDGAAARAALGEARELRPRTAELDALEQQLAARVARRPVDRPLWRRASGAVALLAIGTGLLIAVDGARAPVIVPSAPEAIVPAEAELIVPAAPEVPPPLVGTLGDSTALPPGRSTAGPAAAMPSVDVATRQPDVVRLATTAPAGSRWPAGEVPDDYVAPIRRPPGGRGAAPAAVPAPVAASPGPATPRSDWSLATAETVFAAPVPRGVPSSVLPPVAYPPAPSAAAASGSASSAEDGGVTAALNQYVRAYGRLDAGAARAVWPSVDERALSNAFAGLASQALDFDDCAIDVRGSAAQAVCRGTASYVPKVGSDRPRTEPRTWRFELRREGDGWLIADAVAQR